MSNNKNDSIFRIALSIATTVATIGLIAVNRAQRKQIAVMDETIKLQQDLALRKMLDKNKDEIIKTQQKQIAFLEGEDVDIDEDDDEDFDEDDEEDAPVCEGCPERETCDSSCNAENAMFCDGHCGGNSDAE